MKTLTPTILTLLFITLAITGCTLNDDSDDNQPVQGEITGTLDNTSDCLFLKSGKTDDELSDTLSCVYYKFDNKNNKLSLTHKNTVFNCCPGELSCTFSLSGDTIIIEEAEEAPQCYCNCLYDMDMKIEGILSKPYVVQFMEPYVGDHPAMIFDIDLGSKQEGSFCLARKFYPYGSSILD